MSDLIVKITDVCDFQGGSQPPKEGWITKPEDGYIRMLQIRDFTQNRASQEEYVKITNSTKTCKSDDILIARYGASLGKIVTGLAGAYNVALMKTIPYENLLTKRYLYYFLLSEHFQNKILSLGSRAAQAGFNKSELDDIYIYLPDIVSQFKITSILDKAKELIDKRKEQIEACDELIKGLFYHMFGDPIVNPMCWDTLKLGDIAQITMGQSPVGDTYNENGIGVPLLNGPLEFGDKYPVERQWTTNPTKLCKKNDILFCVRGATAGKMNFADKEYCIGRGLAAIRATKYVSTEFIFFVLRVLQRTFQELGNGSTFVNINKDQISDVTIFKTDAELQNQFVRAVKQIDIQKQLLQQSLTELENNFNALMQRAFKGELF